MATVYYHADADGVCSAALVGRVVGADFVPILKQGDLDKVKSGGPSFILDLAATQETVDKLAAKGPVFVFDHHVSPALTGCVHLNPRLVCQPPYPASYLSFSVFGGLAWVALTGTVNDWGLGLTPGLVATVKRENPGFITRKTQEQVYIADPVGLLGRSIDSLIAVEGRDGAVKAVRLMMAAKSPIEALGAPALRRANLKIEKEIKKVLSKPRRLGNLVFLEVRSRYPIKSHVIQRLKLDGRFAGKTILVAQRTKDGVQFSLRSDGTDLTKLLKKVLRGLDGEGGGHPAASGGTVANGDFEKFVARLGQLC